MFEQFGLNMVCFGNIFPKAETFPGVLLTY